MSFGKESGQEGVIYIVRAVQSNDMVLIEVQWQNNK